MNILDEIIHNQKAIVAQSKILHPIKTLEATPFFDRKCHSLVEKIINYPYPSIIAEFKRKSPSKPDINANADIKAIAKAYQEGGAAAISVLTNEHFFGGNNFDIIDIRNQMAIPVLRKEFIIDPYQLYEAKSIGADLVLLIAEALTKEQCKTLAKEAKALGLEVIMELHSEEEIDKINDSIDFVGVNNRNLKNFNTTIETSLALLDKLPTDKIKISESGIQSQEDVIALWNAGYRAFLIGERFMKHNDPGKALLEFNQTIINSLDEN